MENNLQRMKNISVKKRRRRKKTQHSNNSQNGVDSLLCTEVNTRSNDSSDFTAVSGKERSSGAPPVNNDFSATALPPRSLHMCAAPWRPGLRTAPVQLREGPAQAYHRSILAVLNRITDSKMEQLVQRAICIIMTGDAPVAASRVRMDFIGMLLEKAQDEELYAREYSLFLLGLCKGVERVEKIAQDISRRREAPQSLHFILNFEYLRRFHLLFNQLRGLHQHQGDWNEELERQTRRQMITHLQLGVQVHLCCELLPLPSLLLVRDLLAQPLEAPLVSGTSRLADLCAELLARCLIFMGHLNLQDVMRCEQLCGVLQLYLPQLCSRRVYHVLAALQLHTDNWRRPTPNRAMA